MPLKELWLEILPRFKKLRIFRGSGLWLSVKGNLDEMHQLVLHLAESCPNLRELDHRVWYPKYGAFKRIVIGSEDAAEGIVSYNVTKPQPRSVKFCSSKFKGLIYRTYAQISFRRNGWHFRLVSSPPGVALLHITFVLLRYNIHIIASRFKVVQLIRLQRAIVPNTLLLCSVSTFAFLLSISLGRNEGPFVLSN